MHIYQTTVRLRDTDATGFLYFTDLHRLGLEAFEDFLCKQGITLGEILKKGEYHLPIVHAEADYALPLRVGDPLAIQLGVTRWGTTSFTLSANFFCREVFAGKTLIVHVAVSRTTERPIELPGELKNLLYTLVQELRESADSASCHESPEAGKSSAAP